MICDKPVANPLHSVEVVERILELSESKVLLGINDAGSTKGGTFGGIFELGGQPKFDKFRFEFLLS